MRALTCYPHWAHSIAWLGKPIENRQRPIPKALIGERIAIHAGARLPERLVEWGPRRERQWIVDLCLAAATGSAVPSGAQLPLAARRRPPRRHPPPRRLPAGRRAGDSGGFSLGYRSGLAGSEVGGVWRPIVCRAIVATAVVRPREPDPDARLPDWADPHARYWWALSDVRALAEPVPVRRGQLGLWRLDDVTKAAVIAVGG